MIGSMAPGDGLTMKNEEWVKAKKLISESTNKSTLKTCFLVKIRAFIIISSRPKEDFLMTQYGQKKGKRNQLGLDECLGFNSLPIIKLVAKRSS